MKTIIYLFVSLFITNNLLPAIHAQPEAVPIIENGFEEEYDLDNAEERQQIAELVLQAFRSEFESNDPTVQSLYPYIRQIPAPSTPAEFLQLEQEIISDGKAKFLQSGGFLTSYQYAVPPVAGTEEDKCTLTTFPVCGRFNSAVLNTFMVDLFETISEETGKDGIPKIDLTRYDMFHGSIFLDYLKSGVGILFRAKMYPQMNETNFPYNLGFCQQGSDVEFTPYDMNHRNVLWFNGQLAILNVGLEGALRNLVWDLLRPVDTVLESDFGESIVDVNYLQQLIVDNSTEKLFIC